MILYGNIEQVRKDIASCGREVVLIAACKTQTKDVIDGFMAYAPDFVLGENRVQELTAKYDAKYDWHFIGQLQTNKVKYIIDKVSLIHSLDRLELANEIEKQAAKRHKVQACLIEVNMGGELTKGGVSPNDALDFIRSLKDFEHIKIEGIMSVLPNLGDTEKLHSLYEKLYGLFENAKGLTQPNADVKYLSAGMSADYKIALAHGANMIRLGRIIFGERPAI
ncbi:MAG: YggS family pyridoxal phosphate-dependent enzyme [Bacteroides sp.]|nr:YggS family pyridoxal phosphate-dependent enzyme [Bacillota bacterium]MCM1393451.1 YggS family pyridoxal phosphate-dependent enzyme [[Eubacterium] siraeum]MCM1455049.1 YggS family pyridoxal phosphate-dependent enzyme [Bacteroides sp.]